MNGWRRLARAAIFVVGGLAVSSGATAQGFAQNQAESLSAAFRKAAARVSPGVVTVRPVGGAIPFVPVPLPNVGPFRPGEWAARGGVRIGEVDGEPGGSGVVIDADRGHVLTNEHVLRGSSQAVVVLADGRERFSSEIRRDPRLDLAVVIIDLKGLDLTPIAWGDPGALEVGDWVLAIGRPASSAASVSAGIVSARRTSIAIGPADPWLETDASINPLNSGGPLVNLNGEVVGINSAMASRRGGIAGMGYAVPANRARRVAADLLEFGRVRRAYLGVQVEPVQASSPDRTTEVAKVVIVSVGPGTPAAEAGLRPGDRILSIAGRPVASAATLQSMVELAPIGEELSVGIERAGERLVVKVRPGAQPLPGAPGRGGPAARAQPETRRDALRGRNTSRSRSLAPPATPNPERPGAGQDPPSLDPIPQRDRPLPQPAPEQPNKPAAQPAP
jgi:serine protease Do